MSQNKNKFLFFFAFSFLFSVLFTACANKEQDSQTIKEKESLQVELETSALPEGMSNNIKQIEAGGDFTLILLHNGDVYSLGRNQYGQLGLSDEIDRTTPTKIETLSHIKKIRAGKLSSFAITEEGEVYAWGYNFSTNLGLLGEGIYLSPTKLPEVKDVVDISLGEDSAFALLSDNTVMCWGSNQFDILGIGKSSVSSLPTKNPFLSNIKQISVGFSSAMAITHNGDLFIWGFNGDEDFNIGNELFVKVPTKIEFFSDVKQVAIGFGYYLVLLDSGNVYSWGSNTYGQLGFPEKTNVTVKPEKIKELSDIAEIGTKHYSSFARTNEGDLYVFGHNNGRLGLGEENLESIFKPTKNPFLSSLSSMSIGFHHNFVTLENGEVYGFGNNIYKQIGEEDRNSYEIPTNIIVTE